MPSPRLSGNPNILGYRAIHKRSSKQCKSQSKKRDGGEKPIPSLRPPQRDYEAGVFALLLNQGKVWWCDVGRSGAKVVEEEDGRIE